MTLGVLALGLALIWLGLFGALWGLARRVEDLDRRE